MKIAIYANIGNKQGQDTEEQLAELRQHARSRSREFYVYIDRNCDKTSDRVELQKLFAAAARGDFQVVLESALNRFIDETVAGTFVNVQKLLRCGVQLVCCTEMHLSTDGPAGDLMISIAAWVAQQEHTRISERTKAGVARARAKGKRPGRPWKSVPRQRLIGDRKRGLSWRQLAEKYHVPQSTLRHALQRPEEPGVRQPQNNGDPAAVSAEKEPQ